MRLAVLTEIPQDAILRQEWNALVAHTERPQVFYTWEWSVAVQRAYDATLHPLIFLARDDREQLCGVAALAVDVGGKASFLCATTGDYCDFVSTPDLRNAFIADVLADLRRRGICDVVLTNLPADSPSVEALRKESLRHGYHHFSRTAYVCAQVSLSRLERKKGKLIAPGLKRLRRFEKAVAGEGPVLFDHRRTWDQVQPILPQFIQAHVARFLELGRISNLAASCRRMFLAELAKHFSGLDWLVLSRMSVGDRAVAWHYGFVFGDSWFWYQPTFDSSVEKHWPGFCLLSQVIQDATENPALTVLDLGLGSEAYKAKFANESRDTLYVALHRSFFEHSMVAFRDRAAAVMSKMPALDRKARWVRESLRSFLGRVRSEGVGRSAARLAKSALRILWTSEEVHFFAWNSRERTPTVEGVQLCALTLNQLAAAVIHYEKDEATLRYLVRCAQRLRAGEVEGFGLTSSGGRFLHFAWVAPFNGFHCSELNTDLQASPDAALLFDCWTPASERGHGYYACTVEKVAKQVEQKGRRPWIFSAAGNTASVKGLEKSGFERRYSLVRQRLFGWQWIKGETPKSDAAAPAEVSARV